MIETKPERDLWNAVVLRAVKDIFKASYVKDCIKRKKIRVTKNNKPTIDNIIREGASARHWIFSENKEYFNSFENICYYFKIDKHAIRKNIK